MSQNRANAFLRSTNTTGYKGVYVASKTTWEARICLNYDKMRIGVFGSAIEAARAYDAKAVELFGEFARTNFGPRNARLNARLESVV